MRQIPKDVVGGPGATDRGTKPGGLAGLAAVRLFLRVPLYHKIVVSNSLFVALVALFATALTFRSANSGPLTAGFVTAAVLVAVVLMAGANAILVRLALSAVRPVEDTARRVEKGDLDARCDPSPLADDDLLRLTHVFNEMLDRLEEGRIRQRQLAVMVLEAEERERMWLAKQLYDDTAQVLSATLLHLRAAARSSELTGTEALEPIRSDIVNALEGIRRIARRLRPPELYELGLSAAVAAHARSLSEVGGLPIECTVEPVDPALPDESRLALYRVIQEALNNAVRHADADCVEVRIFRDRGLVVAEVSDDGKGFDTSVAPESPSGSFGLVGIKERAAYMGGIVHVRSRPGHGTCIRVEIPALDRRPQEGTLREGARVSQA